MVLSHETLHYLRNRHKGKIGFVALKLDMSKAYDRVEWSYLSQIMEKLGFHEKWISLVMKCVTTPTFSILMNNESFGFIKPTRGIRQGDPLSPYLFLPCSEGLSSLLVNARERSMVGISICRSCPKISHLFFADDSLIFIKAARIILGIFGRC